MRFRIRPIKKPGKPYTPKPGQKKSYRPITSEQRLASIGEGAERVQTAERAIEILKTKAAPAQALRAAEKELSNARLSLGRRRGGAEQAQSDIGAIEAAIRDGRAAGLNAKIDVSRFLQASEPKPAPAPSMQAEEDKGYRIIKPPQVPKDNPGKVRFLLEQKRGYFSLERIAQALKIKPGEVAQIIEGLLREGSIQWSYSGGKRLVKWAGKSPAGKKEQPKDKGFDLAKRYFDPQRGKRPTEKDFD
jgi:biotin operon repressor